MPTLFEKLTNAGIPVISATEQGEVSWNFQMTPEQETLYRNIVHEHLHPNEHIVLVRVLDRQNAAKPFANNIPNWATWTQAELLTWWNNNLADSIVDALAIPAGAKTVLKAQNAAILRIAQMEIAIRDQIWPDLPEG